jgi:calcineurin-like phosphoesterase family protein
MTTFFTSDIHFGHSRIIQYCNRPFATVEEMDEAIISNWNETVQQYDHIYILGDVSFSNAERTNSILQRLNGIKILIYGNHDKVVRNNPEVRSHFVETHELLERDFKVEGQKAIKIVMCHYAMKVWNKSHHGSLHLFGHSHGSMPDDGSRSLDVGMDCHGMRPISLDDVIRKIGRRELKVLDHHGRGD